jgi:hypothetical protein
MKRYESSYNPAVKDISDYIHDNAFRQGLHPVMATKIKNVLDGIEITDRIISEKEQVIVQKEQLLVQKESVINQKTAEVRSKDNLLVQKEQLLSQKEIEKEHALRSKSAEKNNLLTKKDKEIIELEKVQNEVLKKELFEILPQAYPAAKGLGYNKPFDEWDSSWYGKKVLDANNFESIKSHLQELRKKAEENNLKKELLEILPQAYPAAKGSGYNKPFDEWDSSWYGKKVLDANNFESIKSHLPGLRKKAEENNLKKELIEIAHRLYPEAYSANFRDWKVDSDLKKTIENNDFKEIDKLLPLYRGRLAEKQAKELEDAKRLKEETIKKDQLLSNKDNILSDKDKEIEDLKLLITQRKIDYEKLLTQKENELVSTEQILIDKHQKETETLKALLARKEIEHQEFLARKELEKQELIVQKEKEKKELLALKEKQAKELENAKRLQEENIKKEQLLSNQNKLLSDKEQRIEELKALIEQSKIEKEELLAKQELVVSNKSHMKNQIINQLREEVDLKEDEVVDLRIQNLEKELIAEQKEKLLIQKETEIQEKSFAKNQVIGDLQDDIGLKEKEAFNLKIELLMKQVEFHKKESELKDKASELKEKALLDAMEIVKQKDIVNELQGKLLAFQNLSEHDETLQLELSVIHYKVEESIVNGNLEEMKELSKYLSQLMKNPADKDESLDISELLNNLSPVVHGGENQVQNPLAVINNFDINHINTTHSVYPSGEVSESYEII